MEQAEAEMETTTQTEEVESSSGIGSILSEALTGSQSTPKAGTGTGEAEKDEAQEPPFLELLLSEANKVPIKNEEEFRAFLERNPVLRDGWMMKADHTRKTQEISEQKKQYEARIQEDQKLWGQTPPPIETKRALASIWNVFQGTEDPVISDAIQKFVTDVQLLAQGKEPVGPLKTGQAASTISSPDAQLQREIFALKQELEGFKNQMTAKERQVLERQKAEQEQKDEQVVDAWIAEKEGQLKSKISADELQLMADFMSVLDEKGQPKFTLDDAYSLARSRLGKTQADAAKTVLKDAKTLSSKTPKPPASRASSDKEPEPKSIGDIYKQGMKNLA